MFFNITVVYLDHLFFVGLHFHVFSASCVLVKYRAPQAFISLRKKIMLPLRY